MKKVFLIFSLVACFLPLSVILRADTVVEEIIARVNNQIVSRSEYLRSREQLKQELQQQDAAQADKVFTVKQKDVLRDLIDQQLLLDKGKDLGITADTELVKRLDEMRKQMNLDSMEDLEKAATSQGISYEDFKQNLRNQIITQQVIGKEVGSHMSITKEEEQKFYEEHKDEMQQPEQIKLSEHQQAGVPGLKEMEPRIQDAIYMQKLQPSLRAYLTKLREEAFIDVKPGYVDTGASANQTKPVETTTKEANARKLKKKKKFGII